MMEVQQAGTAWRLLNAPDAGSERWWREMARLGSPLIEPVAGSAQCKLTFVWRDPAGDEARSSTQRVYLDINGITDHHSFSPKSLIRLAGRDVWYGDVQVDNDWRGSYSLIPTDAARLPPVPRGDARQQQAQQRAWWCSLFPFSQPDALNPWRPFASARGMALSAIHLPQAISQHPWFVSDPDDVDPARLETLDWCSIPLKNQRRIWLYRTGEESAANYHRPLGIVLDGQNWVLHQPILSVLDAQTRAGRLPPMVWLFIDSVDGETRGQELPCNRDFWQAVQTELLPLAKACMPFTDDPRHTLVAGQSYGGLAALYAGLFWPERFGCVLTQSGSFWWPHIEQVDGRDLTAHPRPGWLTRQVSAQSGAVPLRIFQEAGRCEADIHQVNQQMHQALMLAGHHVHYRIYNGGHDALCWRGGLIDGACWLLNPSLSESGKHHESGTKKSI